MSLTKEKEIDERSARQGRDYNQTKLTLDNPISFMKIKRAKERGKDYSSLQRIREQIKKRNERKKP